MSNTRHTFSPEVRERAVRLVLGNPGYRHSITPRYANLAGISKGTIDLFYDVRFGADISRKAWSIVLLQRANSGLRAECRIERSLSSGSG